MLLLSSQTLSSQSRGRKPLPVHAANRDELGGVSDILNKYGSTNGSGLPARGTPQIAAQQQPQAVSSTNGMGNGVFLVLLINFGLYAGANLLHLPALSNLALSHWKPQWWQFVTSTFMHANWQHLSSNAFALLVFGRQVEEEEGALGLWLTYLVAGVGGAVASYLSSPHTRTISLGASGAVFGLFMVAVITKFKPSLRKLLELVILGSFVVQQVLGELQMAAGGGLTVGGMQVGHVAHLAGAAAGVLLVLLLSRLPEPAE
ncbi:hypothetical protein CHLNCDRAFT_49978 [Chlorella variabilis]|uniref:Peptidase S54 rhomboid domain-containing protein n=1 Tax=Chlorella variabilis TaxID=554065 RepID=E1Z4X5_CHLVA|nr:hypothetical protein CHLNCDRAFT_49978 [Chlorella variabilis]EFN59133.1 hypothetical protein CHLNCDRAFT_49978 [Chlorella variabilis]|eukprot:XP_005851235.1 hypothetical protein CHLNCDRAFT_49978 [Chlorella variabilis]